MLSPPGSACPFKHTGIILKPEEGKPQFYGYDGAGTA
jgi:hypothetical protein